MRLDQTLTAAANFDISADSAVRMRTRYLQSLLAQWVAYIDEKVNQIPESDVIAIINEMISLRRYHDNKKTNIKPVITDEMIEAARNYPIEQVVEFHKGVAIAFCHEDKKPSLTWHRAKNKATCFPCGKSFNALDVLIERDKMQFIDAVKQLAGVM